MQKFWMLAAAAGVAAVTQAATLPEPVVRWTMDATDANGQIPDATGGGNALELGSGMSLKHNHFLMANVLDCDGTADCWARSTKPIALGSRTVSVWLYREATVGPLGGSVNKTPYTYNDLSGVGVCRPGDGIGLQTYVGNTQLADSAIGNQVLSHIVWTFEILATNGSMVTVAHHVYRDTSRHRSSTNEVSSSAFDGLSQQVILGNVAVNGTRPLFGFMKDFRIYDRAFSAEQVKLLYAEEMHERGSYVVGFWRMEDTAEDASGEGVALNLGSGVNFVDGGLSGKALNYQDSRDAYAYVTNGNPPYADLSLALWMRPAQGFLSLSEEVGNNLSHVFTLQNSSLEYFRVNVNDGEDTGPTSLRRFSVADMTSDSGYYTSAGTFMEKGLWNHFAFVAKSEYDASSGEWYVEPKYYVNGELLMTGRRTTCSTFKAKGLYPNDLKVVLGNRGYPNNRAFWGQFDDVLLYAGALTADEVKQLYSGVPEVSAGADFSTTTEQARLAGSLSVIHSGDYGRAVAAATTAWTLVAAPEGGEGATIEATDDLETRVHLPVEGAYRFRLTVTSGLVKVCDEVVVTREVPSGNTPPTVTVSGVGNAYVGIPYALKATVADAEGADGVRVTWQCVSGPDAVLFEPIAGTNVTAIFYAAGNYVLQALADDGAASATAELNVSVVAVTGDLTDGLMNHIRFDSYSIGAAYGDHKYPNGDYFDHQKVRLSPGVHGYGVQVVSALEASLMMCTNTEKSGSWTLREVSASGKTEESALPTNPYRSFSCWLKYDANSDTNSAYHSVIFEQRFNLGLFYDREDGADVLRMGHRYSGYKSGDEYLNEYKLDGVDMSSEWVHVYALFDRTNSWQKNVSELWVNGVQQTPKVRVMGYGRPRNNYLEIGGLSMKPNLAEHVGFNGHWTNSLGQALSRTFPGYIDEFRMYSRKLSEDEIKMLAMNPETEVNRPPAVRGITGDLTEKAHVAGTVEAAVADDGRPSGSTLTYEWKVLSGDADKLVFADRNARATTVTAKKVGTYVLALRATDGERVTYSPSIVFEATKVGMILMVD